MISDRQRKKIIEDVYKSLAERPQQIEQMKVRQRQGWEIARKCARVLKEDFGKWQRFVNFTPISPSNPYIDSVLRTRNQRKFKIKCWRLSI